MVQVLPAPVWPYAKMVLLYPEMTAGLIRTGTLDDGYGYFLVDFDLLDARSEDSVEGEIIFVLVTSYLA